MPNFVSGGYYRVEGVLRELHVRDGLLDGQGKSSLPQRGYGMDATTPV